MRPPQKLEPVRLSSLNTNALYWRFPPEFFCNQFGTIAEKLFPGGGEHRDQLMGLGARDVVLCGAGPSMFTVPPSKELGTAWHLLLTSVHRKNAYLVPPAPTVTETSGS